MALASASSACAAFIARSAFLAPSWSPPLFLASAVLFSESTNLSSSSTLDAISSRSLVGSGCR